MIFKLDLKKVGYLTMIMGAINIFASPLGYVPYSYKISTEDGDFKKRDSFENFEDNIFIKPIGTNPILDTLSSEYGFELEEVHSSAPLLIAQGFRQPTYLDLGFNYLFQGGKHFHFYQTFKIGLVKRKEGYRI